MRISAARIHLSGRRIKNFLNPSVPTDEKAVADGGTRLAAIVNDSIQCCVKLVHHLIWVFHWLVERLPTKLARVQGKGVAVRHFIQHRLPPDRDGVVHGGLNSLPVLLDEKETDWAVQLSSFSFARSHRLSAPRFERSRPFPDASSLCVVDGTVHSSDAIMMGTGSKHSLDATDSVSDTTCEVKESAADGDEGLGLRQSCVESAAPPRQRRNSSSEDSSGSQAETSVSVYSALTDTEHVEALDDRDTFLPTNWVQALISPALPQFSPTLPSSSFGLAIHLASNRAAELTKCGRRCVSFVSSLATLYDEAATSFHTAAMGLPTGKLLGLKDWGLQWSREMKKLSQRYFDVSKSLQSYLVSHGETVSGMSERFQLAVSACTENGDRPPSDGSSYTLAPGKNRRLPDNSTEIKHPTDLESRLVEMEKQKVHFCHRMEYMVLEQLLLLETDRALVVGTSCNKLLAASKGCLEDLSMPEGTIVEEETETFVSERRAKKTLFAKRSSDCNAAMSSGVMDAETLGLPEEVGKLRDRVKTKSAARFNRLQVVRGLAGFLENVSAASIKLAGGLSQTIDNVKPYGHSSATTPTTQSEATLPLEALVEFESPSIRGFWGGFIAAVEVEAKCTLSMATSLRRLRSEKLEKSLLCGDKTIKAASESDDFLWKQLCDAARLQARATERFRQTSAQTAKMRERVKSVDSDPGKRRDASKVNKHVSKSIANVFSILPDGGAEALKIFAPGARATIAAHSLEEADTRETRGRQQLVAAVEAASRCLESYKSNASAMEKQHDDDEKGTWDNVRFVIERFTKEVEENRSARLLALSQVTPFAKDLSYLEVIRAELQKRVLVVVKESMEPEDVGMTHNRAQAIGQADDEDKGVECTEVQVADGKSEITDSSYGGDGDPAVAAVHDRVAMLRSRTKSDESNASPGIELDSETEALFPRIPTSPQRSVSSINSISRHRDSSLNSIETEVFLKFFWQDPVDRNSAPNVLDSFACSFRDRDHQFPFQYGRMFVTPTRFVFNSWTGRKLNVLWVDVKRAEGVPGDASVLVTSRRGEREDLFSIFGGFFDYSKVMECIGKLRDSAERAKEQMEVQSRTLQTPAIQVLDEVPCDATLQKMDVVLTRHLKGVSIQRFYEIAWSEGNGTKEKPLYGPWLSRVCFDISVGDWIFDTVTGPWCGESYDQKRLIQFKVKRKTHLYIGPPIANVTQTHYCRREGNDKCVLGMTVEFEGIPYSDTFAVEVRWVARRQGASDIQIDVGLFVDFRRNVGLLKGKIRSGTIEETTPVHRSLFDTIKAACIAAGGQEVEVTAAEEGTTESSITSPPSIPFVAALISPNIAFACCFLIGLILFWRSRLRSPAGDAVISLPLHDLYHVASRIDKLEIEVRAARQALDEVLILLKAQQLALDN